ncbi:hypothetical protein BXZ70DRAFT_915722 [Cristinia sonorae]|uniref:Uncharacterized protein n=1 Tax=Cristinia sonorae TaxID=1940300 RepID=A0A8K0XUH4_9AGAR|nr:hypothetical protein BXZ70DRAFT_915722 [Cristinia sonorae]
MMSSSRNDLPSVALKDRIAQLQRLTSGDQHQQQPVNLNDQISGNLKDKIATFERKGAVPIPRGSFGLGAPPMDDGSSRRKGELYGNRVPGLSKPTVDSVLPNSRQRTVSTSHLHSFSMSRSATPPVPDFPSSLSRPTSPTLMSPRLPSSISASMRRTVSETLPPTQEYGEARGDYRNGIREILVEEDGGDGDEVKSETRGGNADVKGQNAGVSDKPSDTSSRKNVEPPELDNQDDTPASSDTVPTPKDDIFEHFSTTPQITTIPTRRRASKSTVSPAPAAPRIVVGPVLAAPIAGDIRRSSTLSDLSGGDDSFLGDKSLALDASEAVIVTQPPQVISPTRAVLVPAPQPSPSPATSPVATSPASSQWVSDLEAQMSAGVTTQTYNTVVHQKVRETSPPPSTASPPTSPQETQPLSRPRQAPKLRASSIVRASVVIAEEPPESPSIGDLAMLLQSAAMLEEQLVEPSPSKHKTQKPKAGLAISPPPPPPVMSPSASISATADLSTSDLTTADLSEPPTPKQSDTPHRPTSMSINVDSVEEEESQDSFDVDSSPLGRTTLMFPTPRTSSLPYLNPTPPHSPSMRSADARLESNSNAFPFTASPSSSRSRLESTASSAASSRSRLQSNASQTSLRSRGQSDEVPPTPPPKSPRYFANFRMRKPSIGTFSRTSYSSEDSSATVATPPSLMHDSQSERSDASSIRSSNKSMKSPKRSRTAKSGLGRAGTVVEKLWRGGKSKTSMDGNEERPRLSIAESSEPSPSHLSPYTLPPLSISTPSMHQRPTSWVSIETAGSDVFDRDLFDSFPSVPDSVPPTGAHRQYRSTSSYLTLSPSDYGLTSEMGMNHSPNTAPATLPGARSNAHAKQRSTLF